MVIHFKTSSYDGKKEAYLCRSFYTPVIDGRWTYDKNKVTCKDCLKKLSKPIVYCQTRKFIVIDEEVLNDWREKLADLEHKQWAHWTEYMLSNLTEENINRWKKQIKTSYNKLSEKEKQSDRVWADEVLKIINKQGETHREN